MGSLKDRADSLKATTNTPSLSARAAQLRGESVIEAGLKPWAYAGRGYLAGLHSMLANLAGWAGLEKAEELHRGRAEYITPKEELPGLLNKLIRGGAGMGLDLATMYVMGGGSMTTGAALTGAAQAPPGDVLGAAGGAAGGALTMKALGGLNNIGRLSGAGIGGTTFAGLTALQGGSAEDIAASGVMGAVPPLFGGGKRDLPGDYLKAAQRAYSESRSETPIIGQPVVLPGINAPKITSPESPKLLPMAEGKYTAGQYPGTLVERVGTLRKRVGYKATPSGKGESVYKIDKDFFPSDKVGKKKPAPKVAPEPLIKAPEIKEPLIQPPPRIETGNGPADAARNLAHDKKGLIESQKFLAEAEAQQNPGKIAVGKESVAVYENAVAKSQVEYDRVRAEMTKPAPKVEAAINRILSEEELPDYARRHIRRESMARRTNEGGGIDRPDPYANSGWQLETVSIGGLRKSGVRMPGEKFQPRGSVTKGPIVIDSRGTVIDGHNRLYEAMQRGDKSIEVYREVPPVEAGKITELHAGINPFEYFRKGMQIAFGKRGQPGGRRLVSPVGTPEITLEGRGIVEPFHKAKPLFQSARTDFAGRANKLLEGIKRGSKEDAELFNKLNDPEIKLGGNAAGVRDYFDELFNLMNEHRTARGQEPVRYQKGYITHIIDFAKEQQGLFQDARLPKSLRFAFEKRTGAGGYKRSAIDAVETYTDAALRDVFYGDALMKAIPKVEELTFGKNKPIVTTKTEVTADGKTTTKHFYDLGGAIWGTERAYAENFIKRQLGWPTNLQRAAQAILRINPKTQSKISQAATGGFYRSLIGAALDTSLKNFTQITNTIGEFKGVPTLRGFSKMLTSRGRAAVKGENLLEEYIPLLHGGESIDLKGKVAQIGKAIDNTVLAGPMRFAEFFLRGTTYHAALDTYIKSGKSIETAHQMARDAVRKLQFAYGKENISPYLQGPLMRPLYQFFSFPTKQTELMYRWATEGKGGQAKLFRYFALTGALVVGGKYAGIDLSGVFLDPLKMVDPDSKEGIKLPGTDKRVAWSWEKLSRSGFIPQGPAPVVSAPLKVGKLALSGQDYERKKALSEAIKLFVPGGRYGSKVYQSIQEFRGEPVFGDRGRLTRPASTKEGILRLTGLRSPDTEVSWNRRDAVAIVEKEYYARRQKAIDLILENKGTEANKVLQSIVNDYPYLAEYLMNGLTERTLKTEAEKKSKTAEQRFFDPNVRKIIQVGLTHKQ